MALHGGNSYEIPWQVGFGVHALMDVLRLACKKPYFHLVQREESSIPDSWKLFGVVGDAGVSAAMHSESIVGFCGTYVHTKDGDQKPPGNCGVLPAEKG